MGTIVGKPGNGQPRRHRCGSDLNIAPDDEGDFKKIIANQNSSGQILAGLILKGAKLFKALGSLCTGSFFQRGIRST